MCPVAVTDYSKDVSASREDGNESGNPGGAHCGAHHAGHFIYASCHIPPDKTNTLWNFGMFLEKEKMYVLSA